MDTKEMVLETTDIAESKARLTELKANAMELAEEFNEFFQGGKTDEFLATEKKLKEVVDSYNEIAQKIFFEECKATENPLIHAITVLEFDAIHASDKSEKDSKFKVKTITDKKKIVDLLRLEKHCGVIGADPTWRQKLNELYCVFVIKGCSDIGKDPIEFHGSENMRKLVKVFDLKKDGVTGKQLVKYMQPVIDAMIGEGHKVLTHDRNWVDGDIVSVKKGKKLTKNIIKNKPFISLIAQVCHHLVTGIPYDMVGSVKEFD